MKKWIIYLLVVAAVLGIDQYAKWVVVNELALYQSWEPVPAIAEVLKVTRTFNTGAAFGMFSGASNVFLVIAPIACVLFTVMYAQTEHQTEWTVVGIPMIVGGALSNTIDRVRFDHVVDYVHVSVAGFDNVSNFADHFIVIGVGILLIDWWLEEQAEKEREQAEHAEAIDEGVYTQVPPPPRTYETVLDAPPSEEGGSDRPNLPDQ